MDEPWALDDNTGVFLIPSSNPRLQPFTVLAISACPVLGFV